MLTLSVGGIVMFILYLLCAAVALGLLWWLIGWIQVQWGGPEIMYRVIRTVFVVLVVVLVISILLGLTGHPIIRLS